jgi:hypothetical protein
VFVGRQLGQAPAILGEARAIRWVVNIWQPQHDGPQSPLALGRAMAGDPIQGGRVRVHGSDELRLTRQYAG